MADVEPKIGGMNLIVGDLQAAKRFYQEIFGIIPLHEEGDLAIFRLGTVNVALRHDPAHQGPAADVLALAQRGVGQFAIAVDDVDEAAADLEKHGVSLISGPADLAWGIRTVTFADPAGYVWELAQDLG
jgi:catechol 2,3-dioxygenase-like lactoylglutathione lyase family enzyme